MASSAATAEPRRSPRTIRDGTIRIPNDRDTVYVSIEGHDVRLTNLSKPFFPALGLSKLDLLQYYADISPWLVPHLAHRAMVMKRYPNGVRGSFFYMKRTPSPHPPWLETCAIEHASGSVIAFPVVNDLASLLWIINLGCIDLHPWYARNDDVDRPDYLHFDLDPGTAPFAQVREAAIIVRERLAALGMASVVKTSGSKGLHVYVPIVRGPTQKQVWRCAKEVARDLAREYPSLVTAEYRIRDRPPGRVLVDYNQNAWGRTLASVYSVRPRENATVSMPVTWREVEEGVEIDDFDIRNAVGRVRKRGDLFASVLPDATGRAELPSCG